MPQHPGLPWTYAMAKVAIIKKNWPNVMKLLKNERRKIKAVFPHPSGSVEMFQESYLPRSSTSTILKWGTMVPWSAQSICQGCHREKKLQTAAIDRKFPTCEVRRLHRKLYTRLWAKISHLVNFAKLQVRQM